MVPRVWRQAFIACMCAGGWQAGGAAQAQDASGKAVAVLQAADAVGPTGARILAIEQPVYMGDRIRTGSTGEAQIRFHDDTRLVVGPDSVFLIERYVLRGSTTVKDFTVDALRGSFRFMSGASPKSAYAIRTPTATIGIRGTQFDLAVGPGGETSFVLFDGRARVCDGNGRCLTATEPCSMLFVPSRGPVRRVSSLQETRSRLRADFPYVVGQSFRLRRDFQVNVSSCGDLTQTFPQEDTRGGVAPAATPAAPRDSTPASAAPDSPASPSSPSNPGPDAGQASKGNPGNDKGVGNAGESPGGGNFGGGSRGQGDTHGQGHGRGGGHAQGGQDGGQGGAR